MRTRFTEEVDTYEKFQEVCRNCSKNYLGYFILLAWGDNTPSDYLEIACDIFLKDLLLNHLEWWCNRLANRRMISNGIVKSARFLKMPPTTQNLYFHLIMNADDDGVVEAFPIMRMVGATEDDLKILMDKVFVYLLNDDLVAYVNN